MPRERHSEEYISTGLVTAAVGRPRANLGAVTALVGTYLGISISILTIVAAIMRLRLLRATTGGS